MVLWLTGSYMALKIAAVVFCILLFINWISLLSSKRFGRIPLGDFIIMGLLMFIILYNRARLVSFAQLIPDGANLIAEEFNFRVGRVKRGVSEVKKDATEIVTAVKAIASGEAAQQMHLGVRYKTPE